MMLTEERLLAAADTREHESAWWHIAIAAVAIQASLGTVHAWSVFRTPLVDATGWTIPQVTLAYTLAMLTLGCSCPLGGVALARFGPRRTVLIASGLYGLGTAIAGFAADRLWLLYVGYGLIGGVGLGVGFVVPVTVVLEWFPERRGVLSGLAVAGFGAGALVAAPIAVWLLSLFDVFQTLQVLGPAYLLVAAVASRYLRSPGIEHCTPAPPRAGGIAVRRTFSAREALNTWQWYALWSILFLNVAAGSALLSQAAAMIQEIAHVGPVLGAVFVGGLAVANATGRLLWTGLSDSFGSRAVFVAMFLLQTPALMLIPATTFLAAFVVLAMLVLLCYGGGFGTTATFTAEYFGSASFGLTFGLLMTAFGVGGVAGPLLIAAMREATGSYSAALALLAIGTQTGAAIALFLRPPRRHCQC